MVVYPRQRGELWRYCLPQQRKYGLSPLARGTLFDSCCALSQRRFIPASAGNSPGAAEKQLRRSVYPRQRGELILFLLSPIWNSGLSPLARGTRGRVPDVGDDRRFIPASAGNSLALRHGSQIFTVYPRQRGELCRYSFFRERAAGLSPLARGTPGGTAGVVLIRRFIPASAGNSKSTLCAALFPTVYPRQRGELSKHNLLLINDFLSQSQSTNFTVSHKQHIHYVKEHLTH